MIKNGTDLIILVTFNVLTHIFTLCYNKRAILMHSCFVTYTLISIILDVKHVFKRLSIPMIKYRQAILLFSLLHQISPILITVRNETCKKFVYVHLCTCFILHIVHIHYVTIVFRRMNYKDHKHWRILFVVNVLEICTNICLICDHKNIYVFVAIVTECVCPYVLMYVRKKSRNSVEIFAHFNSNRIHVNNKRVIICGTTALSSVTNLNKNSK